MKKINITTGILLLYLLIMCILGWPGNKPHSDYTQFFLVGGLSLGAILLLRFVQIKRMKSRERLRNKIELEKNQEVK